MKQKFIYHFLGCIALVWVFACSEKEETGTTEDRPVCIIGAFREEISMLEGALENKQIIDIKGIKVAKGELEGVNVILAYTGMGKVNAALVTGLLIYRFRPEQVIFTGIAGGINPALNPADILVAERCLQHDLYTIYTDSLVPFQVYSPTDDSMNPLYFSSDSLLLSDARKVANNIRLSAVVTDRDTLHPRVLFGTIATGDAFIASAGKSEEIRKRYNADAVEMEGAAVAQVCYQLGVPFLIIRSISDSADEEAESDLAAFYMTAAGNSNLLVLEILKMARD